MYRLVSIISPCYNIENYIGRFLDSILSQTYPNIELILINDGSTDRTRSIIDAYIKRFKDKNISIRCIDQENRGQSSAINLGLKMIKGDFLIWPDADDALLPESIQQSVSYLEEHSDCGMVISTVEMVSDVDFKHIGYQKRTISTHESDLYIDLIKGTNVFYSPGGYMVRTSMFRKVMPNPLHIESPREIGQNFQLLIPISYHYPYGIIDKTGYIYTVRSNSHSRKKLSFEQQINKLNVSQSVLLSIINRMNVSDTDYVKLNSAIKYRKLITLIQIYNQWHKREIRRQIIQLYCSIHPSESNIRNQYFCIKYPIFEKFYLGVKYIKDMIYRCIRVIE